MNALSNTNTAAAADIAMTAKTAKLTRHQLTSLAALLPEIPYDPSWANNTGYFNGLVERPDALPESGVIYTTIDDSGRRIFVVRRGTKVTVIFQRYSDAGDDCLLCFQGDDAEFKAIMEVENTAVYAANMVLFFSAFGPPAAEAMILKFATELSTPATNETVMNNRAENEAPAHRLEAVLIAAVVDTAADAAVDAMRVANAAAEQAGAQDEMSREQIEAELATAREQLEKESGLAGNVRQMFEKTQAKKQQVMDELEGVSTTTLVGVGVAGVAVGALIGWGAAKYFAD